MLFMSSANRIVRIHGPYVSEKEIEKITNVLRAQGKPEYIDEITMDDLIPIMEDKVTLNTSIIRSINSDISIRNGKFGHYIFYKTHLMTKPKFIKLAGFKGNYNTCPEEDIERFVSNSK